MPRLPLPCPQVHAWDAAAPARHRLVAEEESMGKHQIVGFPLISIVSNSKLWTVKKKSSLRKFKKNSKIKERRKSSHLQLVVGELEGKRLDGLDCLSVVADDSSPRRLPDLLKLSCKIGHHTDEPRDGEEKEKRTAR